MWRKKVDEDILRKNATHYFRSLQKADETGAMGAPAKSGYLEDYLRTSQSHLNRYLATNEDVVNDIKSKYTGADQKKRLAAHDRMLKYWKEAVNVAKQATNGKESPEPPKIKISKDNAKLKKDNIVSFNLPAGHACPGKGDCFGPCYAMVGPQSWPAAISVRTNNWGAADRPDFVERMNKELSRFPTGQKVRVHDSGDFYSQDYIDKWHAIAQAHPDKKFYAYTKALNFDWKKLAALPNFNIVQSVGGAYDSKIDPNLPHAFIFPSADEMHRNGYVDTNSSDLPASDKKNTKIGLVIHGMRAAQLDPGKFGQRFHGDVKITDNTIKPKEKPAPAPAAAEQPVTKSEDLSKALGAAYVPDEAKFDQPDHIHQAQEHAKKHPSHKLRLAHIRKLTRLDQ
jgi:hypothetical protein